MATLSAVRDALQTRLATISGLRVHDTIPDAVSPPAAIITPADGTYDVTQGGTAVDYTFRVTLIASRTGVRTGQDQLDAYLSPSGSSSVAAAIDGDSDLGSVVDSTRVVRFENYGTIEVGGVTYLAVDVIVEVLD